MRVKTFYKEDEANATPIPISQQTNMSFGTSTMILEITSEDKFYHIWSENGILFIFFLVSPCTFFFFLLTLASSSKVQKNLNSLLSGYEFFYPRLAQKSQIKKVKKYESNTKQYKNSLRSNCQKTIIVSWPKGAP